MSCPPFVCGGLVSCRCGCCEPRGGITPLTIWNRPGLSRLDYRVGTYASFRRAMLEAIANQPELRRWTARNPEDYGIAIVSMWAYVADILTFYGERAIHEAFLDTALHDRSLRRLAAMVDYLPDPGVAATAYLAYTAEAGKRFEVRPRMRVQSVPGQDEKPQKYEPIETVVAHPALDRLRAAPRPESKSALRSGSSEGTLAPRRAEALAPGLAPGGKLLLSVQESYRLHFDSGSSAFGSDALEVLQSALVALLADSNLSLVIEGHTDSSLAAAVALAVSTMRADSARAWLVSQGISADRLRVQAFGSAEPIADNSTAAGRALNRRLELVFLGVEEKLIHSLETVDDQRVLGWKPAVGSPVGGSAMYKWIRKLRIFGYNAPQTYLQPTPKAADSTQIEWTSVSAGTASYTFTLAAGTTVVDLDATYDLPVGTWLLISAPGSVSLHRVTETRQENVIKGPLNAAVTRVALQEGLPVSLDLRRIIIYELGGFDDETGMPPRIEFRNLEYPASFPVSSLPDSSTKVCHRLSLGHVPDLDELKAGRRLLIDDRENKPQLLTVVAVGKLDADGDGTDDHLVISFTPELVRAFDTSTAMLYANVARATHGETVANEVLGSGDASTEFQTFTLAKAPVTRVPDPKAPFGAGSTLQVRVNGVRWKEVRDFYGRAPDERIYITRVDEEDTLTVRFGDGRTGARVHSGKNNVTATYRHGLGLEGRVGAGSLRTALDRPPGLKRVTNPAAAFGGGDPERGDRLRENAPNRVRTFGRVVSLEDFEDAAREYAGVAKARAVERWLGEQLGVRLIIAGAAGAHLGTDGLKDLRTWLDLRRDLYRDLVVEDYRAVSVEMEVDVEPHLDHVAETVQKAVATALVEHFAFEARDLGEPVRLSALYRVVQEVPGVVGANFNRLMFRDVDSLPEPDRRSLRPENASWAAVQPRLLLFGEELATIKDEASDVVVNLGIEE